MNADLEKLIYGKDWTAADVATWDAEEVTAELRDAGIDVTTIDVRQIIDRAKVLAKREADE